MMLKLRGLARFCAEQKPVKLIKLNVEYDGQVTPYSFPIHTKLSKNLQKIGVPL